MLIPADAVAQRRYMRTARHIHSTPRLGIGPSIVRGLRDLGYRDSAAAICALIDNAIDAQAHDVDIVFDVFDGAIESIAIIDNGFGMVPEMLRAACAVGATCPLGDGPHLARAGFGLPSAPFSIGQRFELVSSPSGAIPARVLFDLGDLALDDGLIPQAMRAEFPPFVLDYLRRERRVWSGGTIVVLSDLDRLAPRSPAALALALKARLGHVFGRFLDRLTLRIEGVRVAPIDPLFLAADAVGSSSDAARAEDMGTLRVNVDGCEVLVRTALLPPGFMGPADMRGASASGMDRAGIVRETNGFVISRLGRRLTVLSSTPLFNFSNADKAIRVEIDFPPELDGLFAPSLSLHQVLVSDTVWRALRVQGVGNHLDMLRRRTVQRRRPGLAIARAAATPATNRRRNRCQKKG